MSVPVWSAEQHSSQRTWLICRADTVQNHLKACTLWDEGVRNRAESSMAGPSTGVNETDVQFMPSFPPSLGPFASSSAVPIAPYPTTSTSYHPYP